MILFDLHLRHNEIPTITWKSVSLISSDDFTYHLAIFISLRQLLKEDSPVYLEIRSHHKKTFEELRRPVVNLITEAPPYSKLIYRPSTNDWSLETIINDLENGRLIEAIREECGDAPQLALAL